MLTFPANTGCCTTAEPVYATFEGWRQDVSEVRTYQDLPEPVQNLSRLHFRGVEDPDRLGVGRARAGPARLGMKVVLLGGGGREHALGWKLSQSDRLSSLISVPGNPGLASLGAVVGARSHECHRGRGPGAAGVGRPGGRRTRGAPRRRSGRRARAHRSTHMGPEPGCRRPRMVEIVRQRAHGSGGSANRGMGVIHRDWSRRSYLSPVAHPALCDQGQRSRRG